MPCLLEVNATHVKGQRETTNDKKKSKSISFSTKTGAHPAIKETNRTKLELLTSLSSCSMSTPFGQLCTEAVEEQKENSIQKSLYIQ